MPADFSEYGENYFENNIRTELVANVTQVCNASPLFNTVEISLFSLQLLLSMILSSFARA